MAATITLIVGITVILVIVFTVCLKRELVDGKEKWVIKNGYLRKLRLCTKKARPTNADIIFGEELT